MLSSNQRTTGINSINSYAQDTTAF
jgi:hypothetical protein